MLIKIAHPHPIKPSEITAETLYEQCFGREDRRRTMFLAAEDRWPLPGRCL
jgi:hypothetical protein